ncbi:MAG: phenylalanine--tRNA ligase beta subunit-related protein [Chloroflexota bacterium]
MNLTITDSIFTQHPDVILGVVIAHTIDNTTDNPAIEPLLRAAEAALPEKIGGVPPTQHPHIIPWRDAYRKFGAKPKKYPSSIENLVKRVLKGASIAHINNLVALYNIISLTHLLPVGGEDLDAISGDVWLTIAGEDETPIRLLGEKEARPPYPNEIIYKDDIGTICRRWNWKEADRTKLTHDTKNAFLVVEAIPPLDRAMVSVAITELAELISTYCGGDISTAILDGRTRSVRIQPLG